MTGVVIGAGRIGCGFVGELLRASGFRVVLVTHREEMAAHFSCAGGYRVRLTSASAQREIGIPVAAALSSTKLAQVAEAIAEADVVATSVGPRNLPSVAPLIAAGLARRKRPVNVLAFENLLNAGPCLQRLVTQHLPKPISVETGFSGALVIRAVAQRVGNPAANAPLTFIADTPEEFIVHGPALRPPIPHLRGMNKVDNYAAWVLRKLYVFSAGHATTAYLGWLKGYHFIHSAIQDPEIRAAVIEAMAEGQRGLVACFGSEFAGGAEQIQANLVRFENPSLNDPIVRVGRDPRRKLGAHERLVGAAKYAARAGVVPDKLALAAAAAFCFCDPADPACTELEACLGSADVESALSDICGLARDDDFRQQVARFYKQLEPGKQGHLLLSLQGCTWA